MRVLIAILGESWRELKAQRSLWFIGALFLAALAFAASFSIEAPPLAERFERHARELGTMQIDLSHAGFGGVMKTSTDLEVEYSAVPAPAGFEHAARLAFDALHQIDTSRFAWNRLKVRERTGIWPDEVIAPEPRDERVAARGPYLRERFLDQGWTEVQVRPAEPAGGAFEVAVRTDASDLVRGALQVGVGFGAFHVGVDGEAPRQLLLSIQQAIASKVAGFFGFLVVLLTFTSVFAESMRKGAVDLVLARPIGRTELVLTRYAAATILAAGLNGAFFALTAFGLALRAGAAGPQFFACAATPTLLFAAFFPAAMVLGIWTRNANVAALGTASLWAIAVAVAAGRELLAELIPEGSIAAETALDVLDLATPHVDRLQLLNEALLGGEADLGRFAAALGHTALYAASMLALAAWSLRRRDL